MSWILGIFIVLLYKWLLCFFHFLYVELMSDAVLMLELDMSTPTPIEVDDWRLLFALWTGGIDDDILGFVSFYFDNILMCELDIDMWTVCD